MVEHYEVNQQLISTAASISEALILLEKIGTASGTWHVAIERKNVLFHVTSVKKKSKSC